MSLKQVRGRGVSVSKVRDNPEEASMSSTSMGESGDSLLRLVDVYTEVSALTSQPDELILLDDKDGHLRVSPSEGRSYGVASTSGLTGMVTYVKL